MATELDNDGLRDSRLVDGIILGSLFVKGKRTAATLYASEFLGIDPERLDALLLEAMTRMLSASEEWARKGEGP